MKKQLQNALNELSEERRLFHSEADFMFELAMKLKDLNSVLKFRAERPYFINHAKIYLDLEVIDNSKKYAIELKYKTNELMDSIHNESYNLTTHYAPNLGRFDFWADLERVHLLKSNHQFAGGFVVFLTNDSNYWNNDSKGYMSYDFNLKDKRTVDKNAVLKWSDKATIDSVGKKRFNKCFQFQKSYTLNWDVFSELMDHNQVFKYLLIEA